MGDSNDKACNWLAPSSKVIMSERNWTTMGLMDQHVAGAPAGWNYVTGAGQGVIQLSTSRYQGVVVMNGTAPAQICNDGSSSNANSSHDATVSDVCTNALDRDSACTRGTLGFTGSVVDQRSTEVQPPARLESAEVANRTSARNFPIRT